MSPTHTNGSALLKNSTNGHHMNGNSDYLNGATAHDNGRKILGSSNSVKPGWFSEFSSLWPGWYQLTKELKLLIERDFHFYI